MQQETTESSCLAWMIREVFSILFTGYINRGRHEGMNGIQVMKYDAKTNCNEEISFLSTSLPYDSMKEDLEKFLI